MKCLLLPYDSSEKSSFFQFLLHYLKFMMKTTIMIMIMVKVKRIGFEEKFFPKRISAPSIASTAIFSS